MMRLLIAIAALLVSISASANYDETYEWWYNAGGCAALFWGVGMGEERRAIEAGAEARASRLGSAVEGYKAGRQYDRAYNLWFGFREDLKETLDADQVEKSLYKHIVQTNCFQYVPD